MKNILKVTLFCVLATTGLTSCSTTQSLAGTTQGPHISFNVFYQSLSPYGRWVSYPDYGQVWIPNAGRGFQPYSTNGHWVYSDYGWTWMSGYSWGWAPFHYGRWLFDDYYGWIWIPGEEWAPAWVAWRNSSDYYGWAPMGPGVHININIGIPAAHWIFVPRPYFGMANAYRYYIPRQRNTVIIRNTTIIRNTNVYNNNRYYTGPTRSEVQRSTHRSIRPVKVTSASRAGETRVSGNRLNMYRPQVTRSTTAPTRQVERATPQKEPAKKSQPTRTTRPSTSPANQNRSSESRPSRQVTPRKSPASTPQSQRSSRPSRTVQPKASPAQQKASSQQRSSRPSAATRAVQSRESRQITTQRAARSSRNTQVRASRSTHAQVHASRSTRGQSHARAHR